MFNFAKLKLKKFSDYSSYTPFVGIRKNNEGVFEFSLPLGFDSFPENNFTATKNLFFLMYRTFRRFENDHKNIYQDNTPRCKDNLKVPDQAYAFKDKNDDNVILYSKISVIDEIISTYDSILINTVVRTEGVSQSIDFNRVDMYLDKAIYIDDTIYIEDFIADRRTLNFDVHELIEIYAFILYEIKKELQEDISDEIKGYYIKFRDKNLSQDYSLFNEYTFEQTINILKDSLDKVNKLTAYKDESYWVIYTAIEVFLYGDLNTNFPSKNGIFWGVSNFYQIWEDMCNTYAFKNLREIMYADTNILINGESVANQVIKGHNLYCVAGFEPSFYFKLNQMDRFGRPDIIVKKYQQGIKFITSSKPKNPTLLDITVSLENTEYKELYDSIIKTMLHRAKGFTIRHKPPNVFKIFPKFIFDDIISNYYQVDILDWKYLDKSAFIEAPSDKIRRDVKKQLFYEYSLYGIYKPSKLSSQFVIPYYYDDSSSDVGELLDSSKFNSEFFASKIEVFGANFFKIQEAYISNDKF